MRRHCGPFAKIEQSKQARSKEAGQGRKAAVMKAKQDRQGMGGARAAYRRSMIRAWWGQNELRKAKEAKQKKNKKKTKGRCKIK